MEIIYFMMQESLNLQPGTHRVHALTTKLSRHRTQYVPWDQIRPAMERKSPYSHVIQEYFRLEISM